ncbi:type II toxin-antitoxin system VapC family toxin [Aetokthonos hydrillicola Thurmond2011]|jgi:PIN domain nuclease of toxin-antitoxin system|uniref:Type II toxin-antitoxin system VapC family toxin n=1 Tax=Aetokthonos hydrillicola Thurmond2011 TaxID=2712845 RepID=A0AAP5ICR7_9CYAN|nr:type II toxin-antitoxin system VapC family toxin [Aetokthonos hydrillicola]MBW4586913.1 type II toxin-antitoxin system VapC family toxin [Aetokthonos hydrillicola CCALA 1050]MDR9897612.1 type II toxin-antitoxin system VapC family toxin [Aetokthonos hydrillicola Thurmond2011]
MNLLLDTHIFLWFISDNIKLSDPLKDLIENENNISYLSIASLWEMSIKYNLGKLKLNTSYEAFIEEEIVKSNIKLLNIDLEHLKLNATLAFHHRDPFDRLIIAQSMGESIPIVTADTIFNKYSVTIIT